MFWLSLIGNKCASVWHVTFIHLFIPAAALRICVSAVLRDRWVLICGDVKHSCPRQLHVFVIYAPLLLSLLFFRLFSLSLLPTNPIPPSYWHHSLFEKKGGGVGVEKAGGIVIKQCLHREAAEKRSWVFESSEGRGTKSCPFVLSSILSFHSVFPHL